MSGCMPFVCAFSARISSDPLCASYARFPLLVTFFIPHTPSPINSLQLTNLRHSPTSTDGGVWATAARNPTETTNNALLPYCNSYSGSGKYATPKECSILDASDVIYPSDSQNNLFITTAYSETTSEYNTACVTNNACTQPWITPTTTDVRYVSAVEKYEISVKHFASAVKHVVESKKDSKYTEISDFTTGKLLDLNNNVVKTFSRGITSAAFQSGDIMTVSELLSAAGVSLDNSSNSTEASYGLVSDTVRGTGVVLVVYVEISNLDNLEEPMSYVYRVRRVDNSIYRVNERVSASLGASPRIVINRVGVKVLFAITGEVGRFNFQLFLVYTGSTLIFFIIIGLFIDFLMLCCLKNRRIYQDIIYEPEVDIDRVEKKVNLLREHPQSRPLGTVRSNKVAMMLVTDEMHNLSTPLIKQLQNSSEFNENMAERTRLKVLTGFEDPDQQELSNEELEALFRIVDADNNKILNLDEVDAALKDIQIPCTRRELEKIMRKYDPVNTLPVVTKEQFVLLVKNFPIGYDSRARLMLRRYRSVTDPTEVAADEKLASQEFNTIDVDGDRLITMEQTQKYVNEKGFNINPLEFNALFRAADTDEDKMLAMEQFRHLREILIVSSAYKKEREEDLAQQNVRTASMSNVVQAANRGGLGAGAASGGAGLGVGSANAAAAARNRLSQVNWASVKSQFRTTTEHINLLHERVTELARVTRHIQDKVMPGTGPSDVDDFEPVRLEGDWKGETSEECRLN